MAQRLPTVGGDVGTWGTVLNGYLGVAHNTDGTPRARTVLDLVGQYGVSTGASASANTTAIQQAFSDAATLAYAANGQSVVIYLRGAGDIYPCSQLTLPAAPITLQGDGPTASILGTTDGTIMSYNTASPIPAGASQLWSYQFGTQAGKGVAYQNNVWQIMNIGFTKTDGWGGNTGNGLYFPKWTAGVPAQQLVPWFRDVMISNFNGTGATHAGLYSIISGGVTDSVFDNVTVCSNSARGFYIGGDSHMVDCTAHSNGEEGFYCDSYIWQAVLLKAWDNGKNHTAGRMSGIKMVGTPAGCIMQNLYLQDNNGPGLTVSSADRAVFMGVTADRNCWNTGSSGVEIIDSTNITIEGLNATESNSGSKNLQLHALKVTNTGGNTNYGNRVHLHQSPYSGAFGPTTDPVDPASDLNGTHVDVGASGGGRYTLAYASTLTPDPYKAQTNYCALTGNVTTMAAPTYAHHGCRMRLMFLASGGTRTIPANASWNAAYKLNGTVATSGTTGQRTFFEFEYDSANTLWIQVNPTNTWF